VEIHRIGAFTLGWGESVVWDEARQRLYFVDCAAQMLHWLDDGDDVPHALRPPSMPAGIVPTTDGRLVAVLHDGLHVIDPDAGSCDLLVTYPPELDGRGNDACADLAGNLITGKLNIGPDPGSAWWYSATSGWKQIDDDISNTNGPAVGVVGGEMTLIIGDTAADYFAYPYEPETGTVGPRRVFGDVSSLDGRPDGATLDEDGGLWCALYDGGQLVRFTTDGLDRTIPAGVENPTDVTFGGPNLDRLYMTSIASAGGPGDGLDGALLVIDGLGARGRPEPRFALG
jgi:L-arabinonolactonase